MIRLVSGLCIPAPTARASAARLRHRSGLSSRCDIAPTLGVAPQVMQDQVAMFDHERERSLKQAEQFFRSSRPMPLPTQHGDASALIGYTPYSIGYVAVGLCEGVILVGHPMSHGTLCQRVYCTLPTAGVSGAVGRESPPSAPA